MVRDDLHLRAVQADGEPSAHDRRVSGMPNDDDHPLALSLQDGAGKD
jgi:hypothetical protein